MNAFGFRRMRDGRGQRARLGTLPPFTCCTDDELRFIDQMTTEVDVAAGRVLARQGAPVDQVLFIMAGSARVVAGDVSARVLTRGACIGGIAMRTPCHPATLIAESDMVVRAASCWEYRAMLARIPRLATISAGWDGRALTVARPRVRAHTASELVPSGASAGRVLGATVEQA